MNRSLNIFARREPWSDEVAVHMRTKYDGGEMPGVAQPVQFIQLTRADEGRAFPPAIVLGPEDAQRLMDELWHVGLRPSEGSGSAGSLAATQRHLDDMRHLVFKTKPKIS